MFNKLHPWQLLVVVVAGWVNRDQQAIITYLQEEDRVLKEQLGRKRLRLTDDQRRRLAAKGKNGSVKLLSPSEKVRDLLQITKLEDVFEIYRNEKEALSSF